MKSISKLFSKLVCAGRLSTSTMPDLKIQEVIYENKFRVKSYEGLFSNLIREKLSNPVNETYISSNLLREKPSNPVKETYISSNFFREKPSNHAKETYMDYRQINDWIKKKQISKEIENQKYDERRIEKLGPDVAALHFFTYREAAVKLANNSNWVMGNLTQLAEELPHSYQEGVHVEAIDCSSFQNGGIRYEGLLHLTALNHLRWLSLRNQRFIDVCCLDRIAGLVGKTLEYLDISSCDLNIGCVCALSKLPALRKLVIKYPDHDNVLYALYNLENKSPNLLIRAENPNTDKKMVMNLTPCCQYMVF